MSEKRKRVVVPLEKKLEALKWVDRGHTIRTVANELGVGEVTVGDWKRRRQEIEEWCWRRSFGKGNETVKRKTMKKGEFERTSEALFMWFLHMKEEESPVSGPILQSKALELNKNFNEGEGFTASNGWLDRWKKRYGIGGKRLNLTEEKLSVGTEDTVTLTTGTGTDQIQMIKEESISFDENDSCDETVISFNTFPVKTPEINDEHLLLKSKRSKNGLFLSEGSDVSEVCHENNAVNNAMSGKRKHVAVSLEKKLEAVKRLDQGESLKKVARELGVGEATVWDWRKKREEIEKWCSQRSLGMGSENIHRKTMRKGEFEKTSEALFLWFLEMREKDIPVSGPILQRKALELHKNFREGEEFTASSGWLKCWKKRFGIGSKFILAGEKVLNGSEETSEFIMKEETVEENLSLNESHSCDETVIHDKTSLVKTPGSGEKNVSSGCEQNKDKLSILDCSDLSVSCENSTENDVMSAKRKHVFVSLEKKLDAIKRLDQGETLRRVASEFGVGEATVWDWKKKREDIERWCLQRSVESGSSNMIRKTMRKGEFEKTSEALFLWFIEMKKMGIAVSGPILQSKALELHRNFNEGEEFTASSGWLERWKKRYGISGKKLDVNREKLSTDIEETVAISTKIGTVTEKESQCLDENHSCGETAMDLKMTSVKALVTNSAANNEENSTFECEQSEGPNVSTNPNVPDRPIEETAAISTKIETVTEENQGLDGHSCGETAINLKKTSVKALVTNSAANNEENSNVKCEQSEDPNVAVTCINDPINGVMSRKRKHIVVSLAKKLDALKRLDQGERMKTVARDLGVGGATVWDWRKKRKEIEMWCSQRSVGSNASTVRKTMRKGEFEKTSEALFMWFLQRRKKGIPVSGPILQSKALELHKHFNEGEFTASSGWLERWKKRYGICGKKFNTFEETLSASTEETIATEEEAEITEEENLTLEEDYSYNETVVDKKMLSVKIPVTNEENFIIDDKCREAKLSISPHPHVLGNPCGSSIVNRAKMGKRKRIVVSLEKKLEALKHLDQGQTIKKVANKLGVGEATVGDWKKKREEIEKWCSQRSLGMGSENVHRKTMKKGEFEKTSEALYTWFLEMKQNGSPVSGPILQSKALELHKSFNEGIEFTASNGWLERWKRRYGISGKKLSITEEKSTDSVAETAAFITKIETMFEEESLSLDENYTCNEKNMFPMKIPVNNEENSSLRYDQSQDKLSTLVSSNLPDNPKQNCSVTVEEEEGEEETSENTALNDPREDVLTLINSIKEEPLVIEENYNTEDATYPEEFMFVSCDTEHEKTIKSEEDPENYLENQSLLERSIKSENMETLSSDGALDESSDRDFLETGSSQDGFVSSSTPVLGHQHFQQTLSSDTTLGSNRNSDLYLLETESPADSIDNSSVVISDNQLCEQTLTSSGSQDDSSNSHLSETVSVDDNLHSCSTALPELNNKLYNVTCVTSHFHNNICLDIS